jgi:hypothetical protein
VSKRNNNHSQGVGLEDMDDAVPAQGGIFCDIRLAVLLQYLHIPTKIVHKSSRFFTKNYAIGPSYPQNLSNSVLSVDTKDRLHCFDSQQQQRHNLESSDC